MDNRTRFGLGLALVLALVALHLFSPGERMFVERFESMGTVAEVSLYGRSESAAKAGFAAVRKEFQRVIDLCNIRDDQSELSRLNAHAAKAPFVCSNELWAVIYESRRARRISDGAFDPTIKPLMNLWGFYRRRSAAPPTAEEISAAQRLVGLDKIRFDDINQSVFFTLPGMELDLGGIAKGYAVDRAVMRLEALGFRRGLVNLGGNIRGLSGGEYRIGIVDPADPERLVAGREIILHGDEAVATSGDYRRYVTLGGRRYGHIIDPASGTPPAPLYAVSAVAPTAVAADWLSTAAYLRGPGFAPTAERECGARLIFVEKRQ